MPKTPKYSFVPHNTLLVGSSSTECNNCGKGANPHDKTHDLQYFYGPESGKLPGCGIEWKFITPTYMGEVANRAVREMRPDLQFIGLDLPATKEPDAAN